MPILRQFAPARGEFRVEIAILTARQVNRIARFDDTVMPFGGRCRTKNPTVICLRLPRPARRESRPFACYCGFEAALVQVEFVATPHAPLSSLPSPKSDGRHAASRTAAPPPHSSVRRSSLPIDAVRAVAGGAGDHGILVTTMVLMHTKDCRSALRSRSCGDRGMAHQSCRRATGRRIGAGHDVPTLSRSLACHRGLA